MHAQQTLFVESVVSSEQAQYCASSVYTAVVFMIENQYRQLLCVCISVSVCRQSRLLMVGHVPLEHSANTKIGVCASESRQ